MNKLLRIRFHADEADPRPVKWPVKHPYWITGYGDGYSTVVSYADNATYIFENWPEAKNLSTTEVEGYEFTDRFPRPEWFGEVTK
ncbi:MAG: hypothetical protein ACYC36_06040 [Bellilinea sp.]